MSILFSVRLPQTVESWNDIVELGWMNGLYEWLTIWVKKTHGEDRLQSTSREKALLLCLYFLTVAVAFHSVGPFWKLGSLFGGLVRPMRGFWLVANDITPALARIAPLTRRLSEKADFTQGKLPPILGLVFSLFIQCDFNISTSFIGSCLCQSDYSLC